MIDEEGPTSASATETPAAAVARTLFPDYNAAAIAYWIALVTAGAVVIITAVSIVAALAPQTAWQVLAIAALAAFAGVFPLRIPKSKNSLAAGDIFIFLLLLLHGPAAAVLAAAAEAAVCAWRSSKRWSSRIASPAAAAVAMMVCGKVFVLAGAAMEYAGIDGDGVTFGALMLFAASYFVVGPTLITAVIYLKRREWPAPAEWLNNFGWLGMGYAASASIAGVLYLAFRSFGVSTVIVAAPMIAMFLTTLHFYFAKQEAAEREAAERASRERAEAAQREAAQAELHLRQLELSDKRFHSAFTHAAIGMALLAADGRTLSANPALSTLLGHEAAQLVGGDFRVHLDRSDAMRLEQELNRVAAREAERFSLEVRCRHRDGREILAALHCGLFSDAAAAEPCLIVQVLDVTARRHAEGRLQHMAYHDGLTNLANRNRLFEALAQAIEAHRRDPAQQFSLTYLDFDRFKLINDSMGHSAGDQFLIKVARRIKEQMRPSDLLARMDGDEFAILTQHPGNGTRQAVALAERIQQALHEPFVIGTTEITTSASIGITFGDVGYRTPDEVLRDADLAMTKATATGKARYALFDRTLRERATEQLLLEAELRRAIAANQLTLVYQPIFQLEPHRLIGFEALARWEHPERGRISPATFIPVAEESGLIGQLTRWAIDRACMQLRAWHRQHPSAPHLFVNVNISGQDLCEPDFAQGVRECLQRYDLRPSCLTLEITENTLMQQLETASNTLTRLREIGVGLSVDDFGTGYSSLSYLSTLPINSLKIDRSFVTQLESRPHDAEIVSAVIKLGAALGKRVIAEGIETPAQSDRLQALGCGYGQGFYLSRPLVDSQASTLLAQLAAGTEPNVQTPAADGGAETGHRSPVPRGVVTVSAALVEVG